MSADSAYGVQWVLDRSREGVGPDTDFLEDQMDKWLAIQFLARAIQEITEADE